MTPSPHPPTWDAVVAKLAGSDEVWHGAALIAFATRTLHLLRGTEVSPPSTPPETSGPPPRSVS